MRRTHLQLPAKDSDLWGSGFHPRSVFGSFSEVEPFHTDIRLQRKTKHQLEKESLSRETWNVGLNVLYAFITWGQIY